MDWDVFLTSFSGFPYPAWCTDAAKIATWSERNSRILSVSVCRTRVHVKKVFAVCLKKDAVCRMPDACERCFLLIEPSKYEKLT